LGEGRLAEVTRLGVFGETTPPIVGYRWHREDDVVHELRGLATADRGLGARVSLEVQVPVLGELTLKSLAIEMLPGIRFKREPPFEPDEHRVNSFAAREQSRTIRGAIRRLLMTSVTVQLTDREIKMLKARTGERDASLALKAWVTRANPKRSTAELRAALKESLKEEAAGKGKIFRSGREAMRWLES
jgi:hypothetical protein